ncbi:hypothetical protein PPERSA_02587 [Pseudocohnilembus persalinus]|uniref:Uncharacterized protein n=1 Tax=Pseudocohnilembus persalinus TaxID=266149 RepID=A0A0V0R5F4_PSEPJ|nr:hypothetical protein PPERSA_02587 [Pseudocohnilembus persalinus]|eukprot:KRX09715.1 hypothetical protein PPERSA_02587 [Pseudocohnilembus persalinus]
MSISFDLKQAPQDMSRDLQQLSNFFELPKRGSISLTISKDYPVQVPISKLLHQQQQNQMFMGQNSYNNLINNVKQQQNQTEQKPKKNNNNLIDINAAEVVEEVKISKDDQSMISENKDTSKQEQPNQDNIIIQEVPLNYMNSMDQFITNLICQDTKKFVSDQKSNKWLCHGNLGFNNNNNNLNQDYNKFVMGGGGSLSIPMPGQNGSLALFQQHNLQNQYNNQMNQPQQQQQYQQFMIQNINQQDNNGQQQQNYNQENYNNNNGNNLQSFSQLQQQSYTNQLNPNYYMQQNNENQYGINNNKNQQNKQFNQIDYNPINFQNQYNNNNNQNNFQSHIQQNEYFQQYNYNNIQNIQNQNNNNSNNNNNGNFGFQNQSFQHNDISSFNQQITNMNNNNNNHINNNQNNGSNNQMTQQLTQQQIYFQQAIQSPNLKVNNPNLADYENSINIFLPVLHNNKLSSEIQYKQEDKQYGEHQNNDVQYKNSANTNNDPSLFYQPPQQDYQEENENDKELSNNLSFCNNNNNNKNNEIQKGNFQTKSETQKDKEKISSLNTNINININNINKKQDNEIPAKSENNDKNTKEKNNLQLKKNGEDTRLNTSHVPINMLNNLIRYMIPIYQLKIPCTCQVNKEKCSRCVEFQTIQDLKKQRCKNIQSFGQFWAHKRIRLLSEHYFIEMGPFQIQAKNYRSVNNRQALYKCMPAFLDGVRNHKLFWKLI